VDILKVTFCVMVLLFTLCMALKVVRWFMNSRLPDSETRLDAEDAEDALIHVCQRLDLPDDATIEEIDEALDNLLCGVPLAKENT